MKNKSLDIINQYAIKKDLFAELGGVVYSLLKTLVHQEVHTHQITYRVKDKESLATKIVRKNYKYQDINEITDLVGFRIILYFEDDINEVERIISKEFNVDRFNSVDKRDVDAEKFGYRSLHYVVSLNERRLELPEYKRFENIKFEIQIRSILQHSWAEIEHDIGYKGANEIPRTARRTFYRIAALLEQADIEFVKLKQELRRHESKLIQEMTAETKGLLIDKASLKAFIQESTIITEIESELEGILCPREKFFYPPIIDNLLPRLHSNRVKYIDQLYQLLTENRVSIKEWLLQAKGNELAHVQSFFHGACISWLLNVLEQKEEIIIKD
jgi:ppGpp synthetase/RelA/SpoT-type nucleotidyltranferase